MNRAERRAKAAQRRRDNRRMLQGTYQTERQCSTCTLCCRLMTVHSLNKPDGEMCQHCTGTSCGIYARRPLDCRQWSCLWKVDNGRALGDDLRPDRCGFIVNLADARDGVGLVHIIVDDEGNAEEETVERVAAYFTDRRNVVLISVGGDHQQPQAFCAPSIAERAVAAYPDWFPHGLEAEAA
jgi:hypothetical protein